MAMNTPNTSIFSYAIYIFIASFFIYLDFEFNTFSKPKNFYNSTILTSKFIVTDYFLDPLISIPSNLKSKSILKKENNELRDQLNKEYISKFIISNNEGFFLEEDQLENFIEKEDSLNKAIFSKLVNFDSQNYFCCDDHKMLIRTISKPEDNLIQRPVISESGILGQVISDTNNIQEVMLLSNSRHYIPIVSKDFYCNAKGSGKPLIVTCLYSKLIWEDPLEVGQDFYSSGLGGIFPVGIHLGEVIEIRELNEIQREVRFKLHANPLENNFFAIMVSQ
jgi:rod shape-determining protein MreC